MKRARAALMLGAVLAGGLVGCSAGSSTTAASVAAASTAPANGSHLDAKAFAAAIQRPSTVILDVRTPAEFASGHLRDAVNVDVQAADFATKIKALKASDTFAVYCRSGHRSATALNLMSTLGYTTAYDLAGGIGDWTAAGFPVVKS